METIITLKENEIINVLNKILKIDKNKMKFQICKKVGCYEAVIEEIKLEIKDMEPSDFTTLMRYCNDEY